MDYDTIKRFHGDMAVVRSMVEDGLITCDEYMKKVFVLVIKYIEFVEDARDLS